MSVISKSIKLGMNADPAKNLFIETPAVEDGSFVIKHGDGDVVLRCDVNGKLTFPQTKVPEAVMGVSLNGLSLPFNTRTILGANGSVISDPDGLIDVTTARITPKVAGMYFVDAHISAGEQGVIFTECIHYKNGVLVASGYGHSPSDQPYLSAQRGMLTYFNGTTDYLQLGTRVSNVAGTPVLLTDGGAQVVAFMVRPDQ